MTIILGIDPGSRVTGYGVVQQQGRQLKYLGSGTIRTLATEHTAFPERLKHIFNGISLVIQQFSPDSVAIEQIFVAHNVDSALKLGHARGAAMVAAVNSNLTIFEYAARQIKQQITGQGAADKKQVQHMVRVLLHLSATPPADAADALAVAITHCHSQNKGY